MRRHGLCLTLGAFLLLFPLTEPAMGQLTAANAAVLGTGNNYTALARGVTALALNPAGLSMPGTPGWSLAIFPFRAHSTLEPVTLTDIGSYGGSNLSAEVRELWLQEILSAGGETGDFAADITAGAFTMGRVGVQVTTLIRGEAAITEPAAELLLFGNAGRTGVPRDFSLSGDYLRGFAVTTVGLSAALPFKDVYLTQDFLEESLAVGATLKLSFGHALVLGQDAGSTLDDDPVELGLRFPVIQSDSADLRGNSGWGVGLDLGGAWTGGPWSVGVAVKDLFHTFEWDLGSMYFRPGEAIFDGETSEADFDARSATDAPITLQNAVTDLRFHPSLTLGVGFQAAQSLTVTTDIRKRFGEGIDVGPDLHMGLGFEFRPITGLSLHAGGAKITDGFQGGGGLGVKLGPVELAGAGMVQDLADRSRTVLMFSAAISGRR
ncbi:conjugal transfer protein TraF [Gemmatimonadota bacterium]